MENTPTKYKRLPTIAAALAIVVPLGVVTRFYASPPGENRPPLAELQKLASPFRFTQMAVPEVGSRPPAGSYQVHPKLKHIEGWMSALGASVAFGDMDNDGLSNDLCRVEPRTRDIIISPAPGTGERYKPFVLDAGPLFNPGTMAPIACFVGDFTEDGLSDLMAIYHGRSPVLFLRRDAAEAGGQPPPLEATAFKVAALIPGHTEPWYTSAGTLADMDGDGHIDLVLGNYHRDGEDFLNPNATNPDVTATESFSRGMNGGINRIYLWKEAQGGADPQVKFEEVKDLFPEEEARAWTLAVGAADLDDDGRPELYLANDFGPDLLYWNDSKPGQLRLVRLRGETGASIPYSKIIGRDSYKGMGVDFGDINGDGKFDIFVSNISRHFSLTEGHFLWVSTGQVEKMKSGRAPYVDKAEPLGVSISDWGWDTKFGDFDNDTSLEMMQANGFMKGTVDRWPEVAEFSLGNDLLTSTAAMWPSVLPGHDLSGNPPLPFYVRSPSGIYYDVEDLVGIERGHVSRGIAISDVDGDGDLDLAVANQWMPSHYYRNDAPKPGQFLGLHVLQPLKDTGRTQTEVRGGHPTSARDGWAAIGTKAFVTLPDGRKLVREVDGGNGHTGHRSQDMHFGLGSVDPNTPVKVDITWRGVGGALHKEELSLKPGWHTILLGAKP